jgi:hypothetical protein
MVDSPGLILLFIWLLITMPIYMLPSIMGRDKNKFNSILLLNIFLGWTVIGWGLLLVWALKTDKDPLRVYRSKTLDCCPKIEAELTKLKNLFRAGEITKDDYHQETSKLIKN